MRQLAATIVMMSVIGAFSAGAQAAELQFSLANSGAVFDTFDINSNAALADTLSGYIYATITNDTLGNTEAFFGDSSVGGEFGVGTANVNNDPAFGSVVPTFSDAAPSDPFYSGSGTALVAVPGEVVPTSADNTVTVSAVSSVSAAPEPSTWLLLFAGIGGIGLMMRKAKRKMGFRFKDAFAA